MYPNKGIAVLLFPLFFFFNLKAQNPSCSFASRIGSTSADEGRNVCVDASGNVFVVGRFRGTVDFNPGAGTNTLTSASAGNDDAFLAKYNSSGTYQWAIRLGAANDDTAEGVVTDASGNVYISGSFQGTADFDPSAGTANLISAGNDDIFVAKYNSSGAYQWAFRVGSSASDVSRAIAYDGSSNVYVTGRLSGTTVDFDPGAGTATLSSAGGQDIFLAKYSAAAGAYGFAIRMGAGNDDSGEGVAVDGSGNAYVTGRFQNTADFDPGAGTANLVSAGNDDIFLASYTSAGAYRWAFRVGSSNGDEARNVVYSPAANVLAVTGYFTGSNVDFNPAAGTNSLSSNGGDDTFLARYSTAGAYMWAFRVGSAAGNERGEGIAVDAPGNIYLSGRLNGTADFDPSAGTANLTPVGGEDLYLAEYGGASGAYQFAFRVGGAGTDRAAGVAVDASSNMFITGRFNGTTIDFDPTAATVTLTSSSDDVFLAKYNTAIFLPITLVDFAAELKDNVVELKWSSASEMNNDFYTIEKSTDGIHFETVKIVTGVGNSTTKNYYEELDDKPYSDISYYRLKQTDFDGSSIIHSMVSVNRNPIEENILMYPNPGDGNFTLQLKGLKNSEFEIFVKDAYGKICLTQKLFCTEDIWNYPLETKNLLSKGMYIVQLICHDTVYSQKLVIN